MSKTQTKMGFDVEIVETTDGDDFSFEVKVMNKSTHISVKKTAYSIYEAHQIISVAIEEGLTETFCG